MRKFGSRFGPGMGLILATLKGGAWERVKRRVLGTQNDKKATAVPSKRQRVLNTACSFARGYARRTKETTIRDEPKRKRQDDHTNEGSTTGSR